MSEIISFAQTLIAGVAVYLAYKELGKWRKELLGAKKIDALIRLGVAASKIESRFSAARDPLGYTTLEEIEIRKQEADLPRDERDKREEMREDNRRLQLIDEVLAELQPAYLECRILLKEPLDDLIRRLGAQRHKLWVTMQRRDRFADGVVDILYKTDSDDAFSKETSEIAQSLIDIARKHTID